MNLIKLLTVGVLTLTVGCAPFTHAQVGPSRFAITSRNNDFTRLLEMSYLDCKNDGHKDYIILNTIVETHGSTLIIQCVDVLPPLKATPNDKPNTVSNPPPSTVEPTNDASSAVQKIYQNFKDTFK